MLDFRDAIDGRSGYFIGGILRGFAGGIVSHEWAGCGMASGDKLDCTGAAYPGVVGEKRWIARGTLGRADWICMRGGVLSGELLLDLPDDVLIRGNGQAGGGGDPGVIFAVSGAVPCPVRGADDRSWAITVGGEGDVSSGSIFVGGGGVGAGTDYGISVGSAGECAGG